MPKIPVQPFSEQKSGQRGLNVQRFHESLVQYSGGDPISLLQYYFESHREGRKLFEQLQLPHIGEQLDKVLEAVKQQHESASRREKAFWLSLVSSIFSKKELRARGFKFSKTQFTNSRRKDSKIKTKKGTKSEEVKQLIFEFFDKTTTPAPNRSVKRKKMSPDEPEELLPVKYLKCCVSCAFTEFRKAYPDVSISETTFRKTVPENIKRPRKMTDMCGTCEKDLHNRSLQPPTLEHLQNEIDHHHSINTTTTTTTTTSTTTSTSSPSHSHSHIHEIQSQIHADLQSEIQSEIQVMQTQSLQDLQNQTLQVHHNGLDHQVHNNTNNDNHDSHTSNTPTITISNSIQSHGETME